MKIQSIEKLYVHELKDLWSAEKQFMDFTSALNKAASDADLDDAINGMREQSREKLERIEGIFEDLDFGPRGHKCRGMEGLVAEAREVVSEATEDDVRDAGIVSQLQRVIHYRIAGYGVARELAEKMSRYADADVLDDSLTEEGAADRKLSRLARRKINFEAMVAA